MLRPEAGTTPRQATSTESADVDPTNEAQPPPATSGAVDLRETRAAASSEGGELVRSSTRAVGKVSDGWPNERALGHSHANLFRTYAPDTVHDHVRGAQGDKAARNAALAARRPTIAAVLATSKEEIAARIAAACAHKPSGKPPLAPFMPMGLLEKVEAEVRASVSTGNKQSIVTLVVHDMLYGQVIMIT